MESPVELPEDMVRKILTKLPVSALARFSCVCKLWRDVVIKIKNPNLFGERHLDRPNNLGNDQSPLVFFRRRLGGRNNSEAAEDSLLTHKMSHVLSPPDQDDPHLKVKGSCNGIVCLVHQFDADVVHLYNPITREVLKLPPSLLSDQGKERLITHVLGFGFDASCNDYKVIRIIRQSSCSDQEIYRHSTRCWSKLELDYDYIVFKEHQTDVLFFNGFFHWQITRFTNDQHNGREIILTFNIQTEKLGEMQYPDQLLTTYMSWNSGLIEMDDSLAVYSHLNCGTKVQIWVMSEYGKEEAWTMKFSVDLSGLIHRVLSFRFHNMSLAVLRAYYYFRDRRRFGGVAWLKEGRECSTLFEGEIGHHSSWAVFRPSLVSLL